MWLIQGYLFLKNLSHKDDLSVTCETSHFKKKKYFTKSNVYNELVSNQIQIHSSEYARGKQNNINRTKITKK